MNRCRRLPSFRKIQPLAIFYFAFLFFSPPSRAKPITNWTRADLLAAKAEWRLQGFKLEFQDLDPSGSSLQQIQATAAITNLGNKVPQSGFIFGAISPMKPISEFDSQVAASQMYLLDHEGRDLWPFVRTNLAGMRREIKLARNAALTVPFHFDLITNSSGDVLLPHLSTLKSCAFVFSQDAVLSLHDNNRVEAWNDLLALATLTARWKVDPIDISHLVRGAMLKLTYFTLWELLSQPGWHDHDLAQLQHLLEKMDLLSDLHEIYAAQRASFSGRAAVARQPDPNLPTFFDQIKTAIKTPTRAFPALSQAWEQRKMNRKWLEKWSYVEEALLLNDSITRETALKKALQQTTWAQMRAVWLPIYTNNIELQGSPNPRLLDQFNVARVMLHANEAPEAGPLGKVIDAEAHRRLMITALAIERYRLRNSTIPSTLQLLVPEFLKSVPEDPIDAQPLRYSPEPNGEFLLYSIALDEHDDGGKQNVTGRDRSFPPKRPSSRFDWLWPKRITHAPDKAPEQ
jgi:hypothetical protein